MQKDISLQIANPAHQLSFEDLHLFARIAKLGSLSAVARERDVPVSKITRALQRIEAAYATRMVHRSTHALSLTSEGQAFLMHCERIADAHAVVEADMGLHRTDIRGVVRVSASAVFADHVLIPGLPALREAHPRLVIDLRVEDRLVDMARDGIDIAIRTAVPNNDLLVQRSLGEFKRALYASPAYLAKHGTPRTVADLASHSLIVNSRAGHPNQWRFKTKGVVQTLHPTGTWQSDNTSTLCAMMLAGLGIARTADIVATPLVKRGLLVPVLPKLIVETPTPMNAVMLSERHRLPKVRACIDYWVQYLAALNSKS
jgi:DNA-binding transcriptional LysR family regulator